MLNTMSKKMPKSKLGFAPQALVALFISSSLLLSACSTATDNTAISNSAKATPTLPSIQKATTQTSAHSQQQNLAIDFLNKDKASQLLARQDEYISQLSEFDWQSKFKSNKPLSDEQLLAYYQKATLTWDNASQQKVMTGVKLLEKKLASLSISEPKQLKFILTNGLVEAGAAYTREDYIVLTTDMLKMPQSAINSLVAHEYFHVYSRAHQAQRDKLYATVNFKKSAPLVLPPSVKALTISNPDEPQKEFFAIDLQYKGKDMTFIPLIYAKQKYDMEMGLPFFAYADFSLLAVTVDNGEAKPVMVNNKPLIVAMDATNYQQVVKPNSDYIGHPEEVSAENFSNWVVDNQVKHPEVMKALIKVMEEIR